jgi:hypothetical protein
VIGSELPSETRNCPHADKLGLTSAKVCCAIISSSLVGITETDTTLSELEIRGAHAGADAEMGGDHLSRMRRIFWQLTG